MSKKQKFNDKSNTNTKNNNNIDYSNNSSFINSKIDSKEKDINFKNLTQTDKFNFIKNCINKAQTRDFDEITKMSGMKSLEKKYVSSIEILKEEINQITKKIDVIIIKREEAEKKLKNKRVFLETRMGKPIEEEDNKKTTEEIKEINKVLENDIQDYNNEIEMIKKEIEVMSNYSLEIHNTVESLKKKKEDLIKNNLFLEKRNEIKNKELKRLTSDIEKIKRKIEYQDLNSEIFLKNIEKWANKKSVINSYDNDKLDTIMEYCPLKYFLIRFGESKFKIEIQFSLMNQILNRELYEKEIYNYFKNKKYLKNLIGNKNIKGDYFEEAAKNGLRKEKFLPSKFDITLELKEIISMDKIEGNSLDIEYLEDKLDEEEEEEANDFEEKNMIIENPENFNNNDDESNYMDIENN